MFQSLQSYLSSRCGFIESFSLPHQPWTLDLYMKPGKLPYRLIYPGGNLPTTQNSCIAALSASDYQVIYYLIWIPLIDFIVICFCFDGIILQHVTLNLAHFKCLAHNYVIFWHQM